MKRDSRIASKAAMLQKNTVIANRDAVVLPIRALENSSLSPTRI